MKSFIKHSLTILLALGLLIAVIAFNITQIQAKNKQPMPAIEKSALLPEVNVIIVSAEKYPTKIIGYGATKAHYELTLNTQVSGLVETVNQKFEVGERISKNEILVELEKTDYIAAIASAKNDLASAKLNLLEEEQQVIQAKAEWQASGLEGQPDSELVLHKPQLLVTQTAVKQAAATLHSARQNLRRTDIHSPFDAVIVERLVAPGNFVQMGTQVATLFSTDYVEIAVPLSARDWKNLPDTKTLKQTKWPVELFNIDGDQQWSGYILRVEQHLNNATRQRSLIVAVEEPFDQTPALYPGDFVKIHIQGRTLEKLWQLPSSALSQRGEIWYITKENTLSKFSAEPVFSDSDSIYIKVPETLTVNTQQVLVQPLNSYLEGMQVNATEQVSLDD